MIKTSLLPAKVVFLLVFCFHNVDGCKGKGKEQVVKVSDDDGTVLVMSGGLTRDPSRHVEAFFTESNNSASCFLPDLPADRNFNTLDYVEGKLVLCGGDVMPSQRHGWSCLHLTEVYEWTGWKELDPQGPEKVTLTEKRYGHTSWKSPAGLLLIGGAGSPTTTEFVKTNIEEVPEEEEEDEAEGKKKKPRNIYGFSMEHQVQDACGVSVEDTYILTGGYHSRQHVTMYNLTGNFWELPQLNTGRWNHGCGSYIRGEQMILVVTGGTGSEYEGLQSTEVLILGDWSEWQFGADLPGPKEYLSSAKVGNTIYISGGESVYLPEMQDYEDKHSILMWEPDEEEEDEVVGVWVEAGRMRIARNFHGMAAVPEEFVTKFCDIKEKD